jgi:hypothetical protein
MTTDSHAKQYRRFATVLYIAAAWNLVGAALTLADMPKHLEVFFGPGASLNDPVALINTYGFWGSVVLFGIGYLIVARRPRENHGIVLLAVIGKIGTFVIWGWAWLHAEVTALALAGGIGDLAFAAVFIRYLWIFHAGRDANG